MSKKKAWIKFTENEMRVLIGIMETIMTINSRATLTKKSILKKLKESLKSYEGSENDTE